MKGMLRQVYELAAVFAIINLAGVAGVAGYLGMSGKLNAARAHRIAEVLQGKLDDYQSPEGEDAGHATTGEGTGAAPEGSGEAGAEAEAQSGSADGHGAAADGHGAAVTGHDATGAHKTSVDQSREAVTDRELALRERNRFEAEINQRLALANSIMLQVTTKLDSLHAEVDAFEKRKTSEAGLRDDEGFKKELEVFKTLKPAQAFEYLSRKDVAESARLLIEMDPRTIGAILQSAKTPDTKKKADEILVKMREVAPASASQVETAGG
ncbi:MAG: hypothetical protein IT449_17750 [Phycisphaerales bacterium]|nr:hypothetical protein [Phycisphaerales bacterium]